MPMTIWPGTRRLRVGMAQINSTVGDFTGNQRKIIKVIEEAKSSGVDVRPSPSSLFAATCPKTSFSSRSLLRKTCARWKKWSQPLKASL